jgi:hypothetical protein
MKLAKMFVERGAAGIHGKFLFLYILGVVWFGWF